MNALVIGLKNIFDLYYPSTKRRVMEKRKNLFWDGSHGEIIASIRRRLLEIESVESEKSKNNSNSSQKEEKVNSDTQLDKDDQDKALKLEKSDLLSQLKLLESLEKKFPDQGAVFDVITWNDGTKGQVSENDPEGKRSGWCVCVDTSFKGFTITLLQYFE